MRVSDFDFDLPPELIAQESADERGGSRLLVMDRATGALQDRRFADLPKLLRAGDLLVINDTRVLPARLIGRRLPGGGAVECLLVRRLDTRDDGEIWEALVHPGQRLKPGSRMEFFPPRATSALIYGEILQRRFHGRRSVRLWTDGPLLEDAIDAIGHVPLPPYIKRDDVAADRERYQTVFARERGSIAAPTAGLHFTPDLMEQLSAGGVERAAVTLHVGYGTFQPIRVEHVEEHRMEAEEYEIPLDAAAAINRAKAEGRRVIAVGTTTTRTLEAAARTTGGEVAAGRGSTDLFIAPGHEFRVVSGLITNFHLPQSSLLMLVSAFAGRGRVMAAYEHAIAHGYRFYSYGDAMLVG